MNPVEFVGYTAIIGVALIILFCAVVFSFVYGAAIWAWLKDCVHLGGKIRGWASHANGDEIELRVLGLNFCGLGFGLISTKNVKKAEERAHRLDKLADWLDRYDDARLETFDSSREVQTDLRILAHSLRKNASSEYNKLSIDQTVLLANMRMKLRHVRMDIQNAITPFAALDEAAHWESVKQRLQSVMALIDDTLNNKNLE